MNFAQIMQTVIRYGSVIAKYGAYLKYLPFLYNLIVFVRQAQARFTEAGTGTERLRWAVAEYTRIIDSAEQYGLIQARFANSLRNIAEGVMTAIVEGMKEAGGVSPLADPNAAIEILPLVSDFQAENEATTNVSTTIGAASATPGVQSA